MILLWILLGVSAAIALIAGYYWIKFGAPKMVLFMAISGVLLFLFAVTWAVLSMVHGELLKAALGIVAFGFPGLILMMAGWRILEFRNSHN
jgi:hypothetical protein